MAHLHRGSRLSKPSCILLDCFARVFIDSRVQRSIDTDNRRVFSAGLLVVRHDYYPLQTCGLCCGSALGYPGIREIPCGTREMQELSGVGACLRPAETRVRIDSDSEIMRPPSLRGGRKQGLGNACG
jgi:hypothetical protein